MEQTAVGQKEKTGINKTAIKNFAIYSRNKLMNDIKNKAAFIGITESGIQKPLSTSTGNVQFFDIGMTNAYQIEGKAINQRNELIRELDRRKQGSTYKTAYETLIEEVAYTWFNRIIAIRFMEVNNYMPNRLRVLSSGVSGINEPELITHVFESSSEFTEKEHEWIIEQKSNGSNIAMDELFQFLFIKQCNELNKVLPRLFEKTNDYTELLLNISYNDSEGIIYKLVHEVPEDDFDIIGKDGNGQIEIIGWLYQYYNIEPKEEIDKAVKAKKKVSKYQLPAKTQLFTPKWVVNYMVENSLGKIWIGKLRSQGDIRTEKQIADDFGWRYYIPEAKQSTEVEGSLVQINKSYTDLGIENIIFLDPAMGSFHIGVYAYEVFMQIYRSEGYNTRDASELIIEKNLYGLEIDKRATQLSYFACMMQGRKYNRRLLEKKIETNLYEIDESNSINREHLNYMGTKFKKDPKKWEEKKSQLIQLLEDFIDAKEYGSLLNVSSSIDLEEISQFTMDIKDSDNQISLFNTLGLEGTQLKIMNLIKIAKVVTRKYDVVITNPPYLGSSSMSNKLSSFAKKYYPNSKSDLFAMFIEFGNKRTKVSGCNAMVTMQSWMFLSSYDKFRKEILKETTIGHLMHMENMVMGIAFGTVVTHLWNKKIKNYKGTYQLIRYKNIVNEQPRVFPVEDDRFVQTTQYVFSSIPGSPIAYWASDNLIQAFETGIPMQEIVSPRQGLATADNNRFLRYWYEVDYNNIKFDANTIEGSISSGKKWFPYNKGGARRQWYGNYDYVVNWKNDGEEIRNFKDSKGKLRSRPQNTPYYFKESITWPLITSGGLSIRYREPGSIHDVSGMSAFGDNDQQLLYLLGLLGSKAANYIFKILNPTINLQVGDFNNFPVLMTEADEVIELVRENIEIAKNEWNSYEDAWGYNEHPFITYKNKQSSLKDIFQTWETMSNYWIEKMTQNEERLNEIFIDLYKLNDQLIHEVEVNDITLRPADYMKDVKSFISYAIGCIFGRYNLSGKGVAFAGGSFDQIKYKQFSPITDNVLVITDDYYLSDDLIISFEKFLSSCFGEETVEENIRFIANALDDKAESPREAIRNYLLKDFYKDHLKTYQKRPIYWLYDSGKQNGFKALVYMHRCDEDTTGKVRVEYLHQVQRAYERTIANLQEDINHTNDAKEVTQIQKRIEKLTKQLKECREYDERLGHMALERIAIDLDDGVKVNYEKVQTDSKGKFHQILAKI